MGDDDARRQRPALRADGIPRSSRTRDCCRPPPTIGRASEVIVEVRDDGPGVSEDTVSRLFKRDSLNVQGAGLALLLISDIMSAHAGRIDVQSSTDRVAHGTRVRLMFPAN